MEDIEESPSESKNEYSFTEDERSCVSEEISLDVYTPRENCHIGVDSKEEKKTNWEEEWKLKLSNINGDWLYRYFVAFEKYKNLNEKRIKRAEKKRKKQLDVEDNLHKLKRTRRERTRRKKEEESTWKNEARQ